MSIMPDPITAGLMRIQDMERMKRLKYSLRHEKKRGERKKYARGQLWVRGSVQGRPALKMVQWNNNKRALFAVDFASGSALGHQFSCGSEQMSDQTMCPLLRRLNIRNWLFCTSPYLLR